MKHLYEEVAYLKGLAEGLEISTESKEGKIIHKIVEALEVFADAILNNKDVLTDAREGAKTVEVCLAIVESAKTGEKVKPNYEI